MTGSIHKDTYTLMYQSGNANLADATTYYFGSISVSAGTTEGISRIYIPKTGTITGCNILITVGGTLATSETSTMSIRLNATTDYTISAAVKFDATIQSFSNTAMSVPVTGGYVDYVEIKLVTATFATNPTTVRFAGNFIIST